MENGSATQYYNEALRQTKRKNWGKAFEFLNKAITRDSKHVKSYNALGMVSVRKGDNDAARRYWLKALKIDENNVTAKQCLERLGKKSIRARVRTLLRPVAFAIVLLTLTTAYNVAWIHHNIEQRNEIGQIGAIGDAEVNLQPVLDIDKVDQQPQESNSADLAAHVSPPVTSSEVSRLYTQAYNDCISGKYDSAIETFRKILEYPSWHSLKDNAQYWLAECYYAKGESIRALTEFQKVKERFPKGNKVFDSELMVAYTWLRLGHIEQAREKIIQISRDFPEEKYKSSITVLSEKVRSSESSKELALSNLDTETY